VPIRRVEPANFENNLFFIVSAIFLLFLGENLEQLEAKSSFNEYSSLQCSKPVVESNADPVKNLICPT
jgi:hypothetical protein